MDFVQDIHSELVSADKLGDWIAGDHIHLVK